MGRQDLTSTQLCQRSSIFGLKLGDLLRSASATTLVCTRPHYSLSQQLPLYPDVSLSLQLSLRLSETAMDSCTSTLRRAADTCPISRDRRIESHLFHGSSRSESSQGQPSKRNGYVYKTWLDDVVQLRITRHSRKLVACVGDVVIWLQIAGTDYAL